MGIDYQNKKNVNKNCHKTNKTTLITRVIQHD